MGPIILACAILYAIPATAVFGAILVTGFLGGAIGAHVRIGQLWSPPEIIFLLLGRDDIGRPLFARPPYPGRSAAHSLKQPGSALSLKTRRKQMLLYPNSLSIRLRRPLRRGVCLDSPCGHARWLSHG